MWFSFLSAIGRIRYTTRLRFPAGDDRNEGYPPIPERSFPGIIPQESGRCHVPRSLLTIRDIRSFAASAALGSAAMVMVRISPSRHLSGRRETGIVSRAGSMPHVIRTAIPPSIRSTVALIPYATPSDQSTMVPAASFRTTSSPLLPQTGSVLPMNSAVLLYQPAPV